MVSSSFKHSNWPPNAIVIFWGKDHSLISWNFLIRRCWRSQKIVEITHPIFGFIIGSLHLVLFHLFIYFQDEIQNEMRELVTNRHSRRLVYDFGNRSKLLDLKFQKKNYQYLICFLEFWPQYHCEHTFWYLTMLRSIENISHIHFATKHIMKISKFALKNVNRLIAVEICKNLLCSGVRPRRSKWRPNLRSA